MIVSQVVYEINKEFIWFCLSTNLIGNNYYYTCLINYDKIFSVFKKKFKKVLKEFKSSSI